MSNTEEINRIVEDIANAVDKFDLEKQRQSLKSLEEQMAKEGFWSDNKNAAKISQRAAHIKDSVETWEDLKATANELKELSELQDETLEIDLQKQLQQLSRDFTQNKLSLMLSGVHDERSAILSVQAGAGGRDAQDWASMLLRMYTRWAEKKGYKTHLVVESTNEEGGTKSATIMISGLNVYGFLKNEHGVHRLVRQSPFNAAASRETSFAMVEVLPQIDEPREVEIDESELKIDVYRSGGKGGQSVNTTDSAVRVTHVPTNITISIQNERSQLQNKETALKILRSKLAQMKLEQHKDKLSELKGPNQEAAWGNQIRNYVMHPYSLVKDARSGYETSDVEGILDGDLDEIIESILKPTDP